MHSLWQSILFLNQHSKQRHPRRQRLRFERLEDRRLLAGFSYEIADVPDFDQFRDVSRAEGISGLPGGGSNHCVPTSGINWAAFIASHGFPQVAPGPNAWQLGPPNHTNIYNAATDAIRALGDAMGTTAADGTTGSDGKTGCRRGWTRMPKTPLSSLGTATPPPIRRTCKRRPTSLTGGI